MGASLWIALAITFFLDILLSVTRASLLNARQSQLLKLAEHQSQRVERTIKLIEKPRLRASLRLAVVWVHFILVGCIFLIIPPLTHLTFTLGSMLAAVAVAGLLVLVIEFGIEGFILPHAEAWAIRLTFLGTAIDFLLSPLSQALLALLGSDEAKYRLSPVTEDELKSWVEEDQPDGSLEKGERRMIYSIFQFGDTLCREIMVPRIDMDTLEVKTPVDQARQLLLRSGHSRVPVYDESIDNIIGLLYAKDLLRVEKEDLDQAVLRPLIRPAFFVPEAKKVEELLREMQSRRFHMAVVVDEYGGVAGLVTLEDIVEEIVGEIRDEYDQGEEQLYQQISPDEYIFQGRIDLDDFNEVVGGHLTKEVADTLGGFIYGEMGRVPVEGEQVEIEGLTLIVEQVSGRRIRKVRTRRNYEQTEEEKNHNDIR